MGDVLQFRPKEYPISDASKLERELLERMDERGIDLLAQAIDVLRPERQTRDRLETLREDAGRRLLYHPHSQYGWLALGTAQVFTGNSNGFVSLENGVSSYDPDPFLLRFAHTVVAQSPFSEEERAAQHRLLETAFGEARRG